MKNLTKILMVVLITMAISLNLTSCKAAKNSNNKQKGAVIGAAGGAILGAIIGNNVGKGGNGELGAVIGGVVGGGAGVIIGNKMDKQAQEIEEEIPGAVVERIDDGIVITFDENSGVYFETNKYTINSKSKITLDHLSSVLYNYPDTNVLIVGHTDNRGSDSLNMNLSKNRAYAVTDYFISKGLNSSRFTTNWFGETQPKFDNETSEGRAKNRRVNIVIVPNEKMKNDAKTESIKN